MRNEDELDALLAKAGSELSAAAANEILHGLAAAPRGMAPSDAPQPWLALFAPAPGAELSRRLEAILDELRRAGSVGDADKAAPADRLARLRAELGKRDLDGFVVPLTDEYQGEYVPRRAKRLAWLTGFTGSAGAAVVLGEKAALFVDGRYTLQATRQVDGDLYGLEHLTDAPPGDWIARELGQGERLGFDPWLHSVDDAERLRRAAAKAGGELVAADTNPVDAVWPDQPPPPLSPVVRHPLAHAGLASSAKRQAVATILVEAGQDAVVLTAAPSIAWLANLRGGDVPYSPLVLGFGILDGDGALTVYVDRRKLPAGLEDELEEGLAFADLDAFGAALDALGERGARVRIDAGGTPEAVYRRLEAAGAKPDRADDPSALPRACKNETELDGARAAHRRDGAAMARFLAWLAARPPDEGLGEIALAHRLDGLRAEGEHFRDLSFPTISAIGPNGAIVHYQASPASERKMEAGTLYLVDSGAHYLDGTTDVTRTLALGDPTDEMRQRFTRVLKGHIALAEARFPAGTTGSQLDMLARAHLWRVGLDYDHGTGHGVGSCLGVHEGPQRISKRPSSAALRPGMILSNEPGYYKEGAYGIRIENLLSVTVQPAPPGAELELLGFEVLTLVPIDLALVDAQLLKPGEAAWLDAYHRRVLDTITPLVDAATAEWLSRATRPLAEVS